MSKQQRHKIKQTIHQQATSTIEKSQSKIQGLVDDIKNNPCAVLATICTALLAESTMTLNVLEDDL